MYRPRSDELLEWFTTSSFWSDSSVILGPRLFKDFVELVFRLSIELVEVHIPDNRAGFPPSVIGSIYQLVDHHGQSMVHVRWTIQL